MSGGCGCLNVGGTRTIAGIGDMAAQGRLGKVANSLRAVVFLMCGARRHAEQTRVGQGTSGGWCRQVGDSS